NSLPYTDANTTSDFLNEYTGAPGSGCGTEDDYLDGNDVVYKYSATDDYILSVDLSGLSEPNTAVFVYTDCADIGNQCEAEGSYNGNDSSDHGFQMSVDNGKDYYFVVSSADPTGSFDYTLTVDGTTCANYSKPTGATSQDYVDGQRTEHLP